jgi:hypothetical protein
MTKTSSSSVPRSRDPRRQDLSPNARRLLRLLQQVNFGRLRNLVIRDGEPVFDPPPRVQRDHKIGGQNGPRPEIALEDFALRKEVVEMFRHFRELGSGTIVNLEVRSGLPFLMTDEEVNA